MQTIAIWPADFHLKDLKNWIAAFQEHTWMFLIEQERKLKFLFLVSLTGSIYFI